MCSIFIAYKAHPRYRLIVAANRDEYYERPTAQANFWNDTKDILAGRDLKYGGTWLGVTKSGKFAAVTNYRDPFAPAGGLSRGELVTNFLKSEEDAERYLKNIERRAKDYSGFNLFVADTESLVYFSNRELKRKNLSSGIYGLSNHLLDTSWQKVVKGKAALSALIEMKEITSEDAFAFLSDNTKVDDSILPDTGIGLEKERLLSPIFITSPVYGTRSSTVVLFETSGEVTFVERTFRNGVYKGDEVKFNFQIQNTTVTI